MAYPPGFTPDYDTSGFEPDEPDKPISRKVTSGPPDTNLAETTTRLPSQSVNKFVTTPTSKILKPASSNFISSAYHAANDPLLNKLKINDTQIFDPRAAADYYDPAGANKENQARIPSWVPYIGGGTWRSLGAGTLEGAGNAVSGLSTPLNLATMGAFKGASALGDIAPAAARGLKLAGEAMSAPVAAHGAYQAATAPTLGEKAFGAAEMAGGAAGMMGGMRSSVKPNLSPEIQPNLGELTAQRINELRMKADQVVKSGPEPLMKPEEIPAAKARYNELLNKATSGQISHPELIEGQQLDKHLREVNFGETGQPGSTEQQRQQPKLPEQGVQPEVIPQTESSLETGGTEPVPFNRRKNVTDYEAKIDELISSLPPEMQQSFNVDSLQGLDKTPNASSQTAASAEALSRQQGMRKRSEQYVVFDRAGNKRVLVGPEAVDYQPSKGETYAIETPRGFVKLTDNGGNIVGKVVKGRKTEYPGYKGTTEEPSTSNDVSTSTIPKQAAGFGSVPASETVPETQTDGNGGNEIPPGGTPGGVFGSNQQLSQPMMPMSPPQLKTKPSMPPGIPTATKDGIIRNILGANKAILTSWDLSAPGRQGKAFILNKSWWNSLDDMVKAWGSKDAAHMIDQSIIDHPSGYFKPDSNGKSFADKVGLDIAPHEEMFNTTVGKTIGKLGLVERSSRAHTAFLNKLRSDQFVAFMDAAKATGQNPETNLVQAKAFADFINDATGRGSLNFGKYKLEKNANALNDLFFAPRNMSGQIRTWNRVLNPYEYYKADPILRKQALKSLFAIAGTGVAAGEMAKLVPGVQVSNDPTSADFRKIKIGDTRIDFFGGYQQLPVAAMKLLTGTSASTTSGKVTDLTGNRFGQQTRASVAERFFTNRLAPLPSFVWAWMNNREFDGKPFEVKKALFERVFPIAMKDIYDMAQTDPVLAAVMAAPTTLGLSNTQTYTGR